MDQLRRRGRRGRNHSRQVPSVVYGGHNFSPASGKPWSLLSGLYSFFIMSSLITIVYLMLEYHCSNCSAKCNIKNFSRNIDDIAKNLSRINQSYHALEKQLSKLTLKLPKLEGQIEILEALAKTMETNDLAWNPRSLVTLPNVDVYLTKNEHGKNVSCRSSILPEVTV